MNNLNQDINEYSYSKSIDLLFIVFTGFLFLVTIIFSDKIQNWMGVALNFFLIGIIYILLSRLLQLIKKDFIQLFTRGILIAVFNGLIFTEIQHLQHIFVNGWLDQSLIDFDNKIFGIELTVAFDKITTPVLTEMMMFAYTIYVPLIVFVGIFCYVKSGKLAGEDYFFRLTLTYFLSYLGFLIYPIAGPLFYQPEIYNNQLSGWIFTYFGEWIRQNAHYPGGNLPSPHCAAGTIMLTMLWKYNKLIFYFLLPIIVLLYFSTVYGRYHYAMDSITGILLGLLVFYFVEKIHKIARIIK
ncbi:MAG: hypothetical protein IGBAC_1642 [Ignavibacteriae bacterium]|nr:MAG: hypothetical protein IGBAC_1642 [Ignavibacteriota bacterium]